MIMKTKHIALAVIVCLFGFSRKAEAQKEKMQVAIIYQLTKLVEWCPSGKQGNFIIGVVCDDHNLLNELNVLSGRMVSNQQIEVKKFDKLDEINTANILFVSNSKTCDLPTIVSQIGSSCTLIIADKIGAANEGAAISLFEKEGKISIEFNSKYANEHSLVINKRVLELAENIF